jgi:large subunit ribosomal protein L18e
MFINNLFIGALPDVGRVRTMKRIFKTDPNLLALIDDLKAKERETGAAIWRDIAKRLEKPRRNWAELNLSGLDRYTEAGDTVLVPGKVLAAGSISKKVTVAAYSFSEKAEQAINAAGGKTMSIADLMAANPKGSGVRIMR